jgi:hypothetical protein
MRKKTIFSYFTVVITAAAVAFGFYYGLGDNHNTTALDRTIDPGTYTSTVNNNNPTGDLVGAWTQGAVPVTPRLAGIGVSFQRNDTGWIFMCGGDLDYAGTVTNTNHRYNINTNTWDARAVIPSQREYFGGAQIGNYMYSVAGMTTSYFSAEDKHCYRYDINANTWTQVADITPESSQGIAGNRAVGYQDSLIYCAGGFNAGSSNAISSVYLYNANTNTWRTATSLPAVRCMGAFTVKGDTLIWVGGGTSYFAGYNTTTYKGMISQSDRATITWTTVASYPGVNGYRYNAEPWGPKGIIVGGGTNSTFGSSNECYVYSPGNNAWTVQPVIPHAIGSTHSGTVFYSSGLMKFVCASGEQYPTSPYAAPYTQIYTDTGAASTVPFPPYCMCDSTGYTAITGTPGPSGDDEDLTVNIGFTFSFMGKSFTQATICTNGFTILGSSTFASFSNNLCGTTSGENPMFAPFWDDLNTLNGGNIQYTTQGSAPNRIFIVQFTDVHYFSGSGTVTDQLKLYENGDKIEFIYGPAIDNASASGSVGESDTLGGSGHVYSLTPGATCGATTYSQTVCNNTIAYTSATFPAGRRYTFNCPVGIEPVKHGLPSEYKLAQNYPNPFNPTTKISYALPKAGNVELKIFDILGREVTTLVNEYKTAGSYTVQFDASKLASGVYFYRIKAGDFTASKKMLLVK